MPTFWLEFCLFFGDISATQTLHSLECRVNADFLPLFWNESGRSDWQPADLPKGTGYDLTTARRCFAKV